MDKEALKLLRKGKTLTLQTDTQQSFESPFALERGLVVIVPSHTKEERLRFSIKGKDETLVGIGKLSLLGKPRDLSKERGLLIYRNPSSLPLIKQDEVRVGKVVIEELSMEKNGKLKPEEVQEDLLFENTSLKYVRALKPWTFQQTLTSAVIAALISPNIDVPLLLLIMVTLLLAHSVFNMMNDYFDSLSSLDKPESMGSMGSRVLVDKLIDARTHKIYMAGVSLTGLLLAAYILSIRPYVVPYFALGLLCGGLYSVPRYGLRWVGLGDLAIFLAWGPGIFLGTYVSMGGRPDLAVDSVAVSMGLLVTAIAHINNWRDMRDELDAGVRSVASLLGDTLSLYYYLILIYSPYPLFGLAVALDHSLFPLLGSYLTIPWAIRLTKVVFRQDDPRRNRLDLETAKFTALHMYFTAALLLLFKIAAMREPSVLLQTSLFHAFENPESIL